MEPELNHMLRRWSKQENDLHANCPEGRRVGCGDESFVLQDRDGIIYAFDLSHLHVERKHRTRSLLLHALMADLDDHGFTWSLSRVTMLGRLGFMGIVNYRTDFGARGCACEREAPEEALLGALLKAHEEIREAREQNATKAN
jgi:hypothetical protein